MLETYKAIVRGNHIEWRGEVPNAANDDTDIEVFVTILVDERELKTKRASGLAKGKFVVPDDFDASLPDDVLAGFEN